MQKMIINEEKQWLTFKNGSHDAFQNIYHQHFNKLFEYGARLISDKNLVKDAIHDLFVKLWNNKSNLADVSNVRSYLLVGLRSMLLNKIQKDNKLKLFDEIEQIPFEMEFSVESIFVDKETKSQQTRLLLDALNQLSPRQKEVLYLRYFEEMDYDQIAGIMDITVKATYKLSARAIDALRQVMNTSRASVILLLTLMRSEFL